MISPTSISSSIGLNGHEPLLAQEKALELPLLINSNVLVRPILRRPQVVFTGRRRAA